MRVVSNDEAGNGGRLSWRTSLFWVWVIVSSAINRDKKEISEPALLKLELSVSIFSIRLYEERERERQMGGK